MKDWKTYAIALLALWCAYLTWRTMPYQIWEANEAQTKSSDDCLWIWNRHDAGPVKSKEEQLNELRAKIEARIEERERAMTNSATASKIQ